MSDTERWMARRTLWLEERELTESHVQGEFGEQYVVHPSGEKEFLPKDIQIL